MTSQEREIPPGQALLFEQFGLIRRTWYWVLLAAAVASAGVFFYVTTYVEAEYLAVADVVPPRKSSTPLDNLLGDVGSGLKSLSISKLIGRRSDESGYSTFSVLTSTPVLDSLIVEHNLADVYDLPPERHDLILATLSGMISFDASLEGPITVAVYDTDPQRAAAMANDAVRFANSLLRDLNRRETEPITAFISERYDRLSNEREAAGSKLESFMSRTNLFEPELQLPAAAQALIDARVEEGSLRTQLSVLEQTLGSADPMVKQQQALLDQAIAERRKLERGGAGVGPSVSTMSTDLMEYTRLRSEYEVASELLAVIEPMVEQAEFDETRDIPQLILLHEAAPPVEKARPRRGLAVISTFLGTMVLAYLVIALVAFFRSFSARYARYRESVDTSGSDISAPGSDHDPSDRG